MNGPINRYECPISTCGWHHDEPSLGPLDPWAGSIEATIQATMMSGAIATNGILQQHFQTHDLVEWLRELQQQRTRGDRLERQIADLADIHQRIGLIIDTNRNTA